MGLLDRFRKQKKSVIDDPAESIADDYGFNPNAHRIMLGYLRKLWAGAAPDPVFEQKSLSRDLRFNTLNFAEVLFAMSQERQIPVDTIADFLGCGIPGGGDTGTANLLQRIAILADSFSDEQRDVLLASGVIGDPSEIAPIAAHFDRVEFIVKYCRAIDSLKTDDMFGRRKGGYVEIDDDAGW